MKIIKKSFGVVWIMLGILGAYYMIVSLIIPHMISGRGEEIIEGSIQIFLVPIISLSLIIFGYYAILGEYSE